MNEYSPLKRVCAHLFVHQVARQMDVNSKLTYILFSPLSITYLQK